MRSAEYQNIDSRFQISNPLGFFSASKTISRPKIISSFWSFFPDLDTTPGPHQFHTRSTTLPHQIPTQNLAPDQDFGLIFLDSREIVRYFPPIICLIQLEKRKPHQVHTNPTPTPHRSTRVWPQIPLGLGDHLSPLLRSLWSRTK